MRKREKRDQYNYDEIYRKNIEETKEDLINSKHRKNSRGYTYIRKTIISGKVLECEIYPIWNNRKDIPRTRIGESREAQKNLNNKNARKKIERLVNTNFSNNDLMITLTYKNNHVPNEEEAKKDIVNYINRLKRRRKKDGIKEPLKYLYVIEYDNREGPGKKKTRIHHHIIINKMNRDAAEEVWRKGRTDSMKLQIGDDGLSGISKYISKNLLSGRRWSYSKNLKKPIIRRSMTTLSKRKVENVALNENSYKEFFESQYKDKYKYYDCNTYYSDYAAGFYLYARMVNKDITGG